MYAHENIDLDRTHLERILDAVERMLGAQRVGRAPVDVHVVEHPRVVRAQPAPLEAVVHETDVHYEQIMRSFYY